MKPVKSFFVVTGLLLSTAVLAQSPALHHAGSGPEAGAPGVEWSKSAKANCKKLGGKWKPIRQICKIKSTTIPGL